MILDEEVWRSLDNPPEENQRCLVMITKILTFKSKDETGHTTWQEHEDPTTQKFIGWIPL